MLADPAALPGLGRAVADDTNLGGVEAADDADLAEPGDLRAPAQRAHRRRGLPLGGFLTVRWRRASRDQARR